MQTPELDKAFLVQALVCRLFGLFHNAAKFYPFMQETRAGLATKEVQMKSPEVSGSVRDPLKETEPVLVTAPPAVIKKET